MLKIFSKYCFFLFAFSIILAGCADIEEVPVLDDFKVVPAEHEAKKDSKPKQFYAVGYYSDDSTNDLTDESTWATNDSTGDSLLNSSIPGMVFFVKTGWHAIIATYHDVSSDKDFSATALINITE